MIRHWFVVALAVALNSSFVQAADAIKGSADAGSQKNRMCTGCHGIPGWRTAFPEVYGVPKIGGQHQAYLIKALQEYKAGDRTHPSMRAIAASLSDQDMADLAAYYGKAPVAQAAISAPPASPAPAAPVTNK